MSLITIGVTCFNSEATIERAIQSARAQDWLNFEIVIVDDCSTDGSLEIIRNIQSKDKRVRLYCHDKNSGYPAALNTIVNNAKGDYIVFFDDDDESEANRLTYQFQMLAQFQKGRPEVPVLCYSHRRVFVDGTERPDAFVYAIGATKPEPNGYMVADYILWHNEVEPYSWGEFGSCTLMASTSVLREFVFDTKFRRCAEWDLAIRVALQGGYFISVGKPLVRQYKTQTSDKQGTKPLHYALMLRKKHKHYLRQNGVYVGAVSMAYARFYYFRKKYWAARLFLLFACLSSPSKLMLSEIKKKYKHKKSKKRSLLFQKTKK